MPRSSSSLWALVLTTCHSALCYSDSSWPGFRGSGHSISTAKDLPLKWELRGPRKGGWNIRLPGYGQSSPVVWGDRVFVTAVSGEKKEKLHLLAFSLADGTKLWEKEFAGTQQVADSDAVSRGAPTPVVDAERLYVLYESGDLFALTHDGEVQWTRSIVNDYGEFKGPHGYSSSPVLSGDKVIIQACHGGPSYILAVSQATGENVWKVDHPSQTGWSTPAVVTREGGDLIVVSTVGSVRGFSGTDGREEWFVTGLAGNSTASPTVEGDIVVIGAGQRDPGSPGASLAIRLGGQGDVTGTHVLWTSPKATTGYSSPLIHRGMAYIVNKVGAISCVDIQTGEVRWTERLAGACWVSPVAVGDHVVFFSKDGEVTVYKAGPEKEQVAESSVSSTDILYGVAAVDGAWIIRTGRGLTKVTASAPAGPNSPNGPPAGPPTTTAP